MSRARTLATALALSLCGCRDASFTCEDDGECSRDGAAGVCEVNGHCSFEDDSCPSGRRFGALAPAGIANSCVPLPGEMPHSGTDGLATSGGTTDSAGPTGVEGGSSAAPDGSSTATGAIEDPCPADWWDCAWTQRQPVRIEALSTAALPDFVIPIRMTMAEFEGTDDLRFVLDDQMLAHQFDGETAWVRIPELPAAQPLELHAYFGNLDASPHESSAAWSEEFALVLHGEMNLDATDRNVVTDAFGTTVVDGVFGQARRFDDDGDAVLLQAGGALANLRPDGLTLSVWIRVLPKGVGSFGRIFDNMPDGSLLSGWRVAVREFEDPSQFLLQVDRGFSSQPARDQFSDVPTSRWAHLSVSISADGDLVATIDGAPMTLELSEPPAGELLDDATQDIAIGNRTSPLDRAFNGDLDELRIYRGVRSEAWLQAERAFGTQAVTSFGPAESTR